MANIFDGIHKMDIEELQYLLATLETMTVSNISSEIGQKAKKSVVKAVNFVNDFFNKKKIDETAVISMEKRLKDNKKKLEILSRQQLEKRLRSTIVSKLKIFGENITEADSNN